MIAVASAAGRARLPDVPTFAESGFPKVVVDSRYGLLAPAATPRETIAKLNAAIGKALGTSEIRETLRGAGPRSGDRHAAGVRRLHTRGDREMAQRGSSGEAAAAVTGATALGRRNLDARIAPIHPGCQHVSMGIARAHCLARRVPRGARPRPGLGPEAQRRDRRDLGPRRQQRQDRPRRGADTRHSTSSFPRASRW